MIKWYLATNEVNVFHYGEMDDSMDIVTGQPLLLFYNNKERLIATLASYGQEYKEPVYLNIDDPQTPEATLPE